MLELHNLQKSSDQTPGPENLSTVEPIKHEIYLDREAALREFDRDTEAAKNKNFKESVDEKIALLLNNARVLMKHQEYSLALNLLRTATNQNSKNIKILDILAECLEKTLRFDEALKVRTASVRVENGP